MDLLSNERTEARLVASNSKDDLKKIKGDYKIFLILYKKQQGSSGGIA